MSGFGSGKASGLGRRYHVECASVNRKGLEIVITLPRGFTSLEPQVREAVQKKIQRGRIHISVTDEVTTLLKKNSSFIDHAVAKAAFEEFQQLQESLHLSGPITLESILQVPGVLSDTTSLEQVDLVAAWEPLHEALDQALHMLLTMRQSEGKNLVADLKKRLHVLEETTQNIEERVPFLFENRRQQLMNRLLELGVPLSSEDPSLLRELAFFAERSDINEEVIRLQSHLLQCRELLITTAGARTFDYLAQEMFREFNTLSNKASDATISRWVVQSKSELDKIREQLANLE